MSNARPKEQLPIEQTSPDGDVGYFHPSKLVKSNSLPEEQRKHSEAIYHSHSVCLSEGLFKKPTAPAKKVVAPVAPQPSTPRSSK